ncbi:hypothetical protein K469DRAFT_713930 [Zopfia rhizophila CBS 207.26]|uniref:SP-RING-type domain-containing protein n=1 Tax=Zopfia rhizophila CBS 207.26 TaxID=1314779 RepID=A0A6A6DS62_9PEZI|nr:hypothetical protein K469DRAFT_713930 [Zopfia rhizophila CBS 207.26]
MSSRNRKSTAASTPSRPRASDQLALPPYRKPSHPFNPRAQAQLNTIYNTHSLKGLKTHHKKAEELITEAAALINDQLRDREERVRRKRKKWERGVHTHDQEREEQGLDELKEKVQDTTRRLEEGIRGVVDGDVSAERAEESLKWVKENAQGSLAREYEMRMSQRQSQSQTQTQRRRKRRDEDGDEDMEDEEEESSPGPTPLDGERIALTGPSELFEKRILAKKSEYLSRSHGWRYSKNNAYIGFKRMLHDAQHGDNGPPLPHPDTWFTERGSPTPGVTAVQNTENSDDDLVIDKATISDRCPITLQKFKEPYTSNKCPHSYEKEAILQMIRGSGARIGGTGIRGHGERAVQCPVGGCDQMISAADLYLDAILVRKIKRMQEEERWKAEAEDSDPEDGMSSRAQYIRVQNKGDQGISDDDNSMMSPPRRRHTESVVPATQEPPRSSIVLDLGEPSEEDEE